MYVDAEAQLRAVQILFVTLGSVVAILAIIATVFFTAQTIYFKSKRFKSGIAKLVRVLAAASVEDKKVTIIEEKKLFFTQYYVRVPFEHAGAIEYPIPFLGLSIARKLVARVEADQDERLARKISTRDITKYLRALPRRNTDGHDFN